MLQTQITRQYIDLILFVAHTCESGRFWLFQERKPKKTLDIVSVKKDKDNVNREHEISITMW
jgi:hypothetical protein